MAYMIKDDKGKKKAQSRMRKWDMWDTRRETVNIKMDIYQFLTCERNGF